MNEEGEERRKRISLLNGKEKEALKLLVQELKTYAEERKTRNFPFQLSSSFLQIQEESAMQVFRVLPEKGRGWFQDLYQKQLRERVGVFQHLGIVLGTTSPIDLDPIERELWKQVQTEPQNVTIIHRRWKWTLGKETYILVDLCCNTVMEESGYIFLLGTPIYRIEGGTLTLCSHLESLHQKISEALPHFQEYRRSCLGSMKRKVHEIHGK